MSTTRTPLSDAGTPSPERALSTLESDGRRRWLYPKLSKGKLWQARRLVAYGLIGIYAVVPYIHLNGRPLVLLDVVRRQFHLFGMTFLPTDTTLLALLLLIVGLSIFLATAVLGRVWCGWACPQTVYMEYIFRPIERLFTGTTSRGGKPKNVATWRKIAMYATYLFIAFHLAHTLLAYFIGVDQVHKYIWSSTPFQHPAAFLVVLLATAWIMWDFAYWREQMCIIGCPYGRMQSVLLDRNSLVVSYDYRRGEPRGRGARGQGSGVRGKKGSGVRIGLPQMAARALPTDPWPLTPDPSSPLTPDPSPLGDCVDCTMCVQVCPTGIDIRDGLQLECVNCTQCIDACDSVMDKVGLPRGLIGFSSQARRAGEAVKWLRPRVIVYPAIIFLLTAIFAYLLFTRPAFDLTVLRNPGRPFNVLADDRIENTMRLKLVNRTRSPRTYSVEAIDAPDADIRVDASPTLDPLEVATVIVRISVPPDRFGARDHVDVQLRIRSDQDETRSRFVRLLGPAGPLGTRQNNQQEPSR